MLKLLFHDLNQLDNYATELSKRSSLFTIPDLHSQTFWHASSSQATCPGNRILGNFAKKLKMVTEEGK